MNIQGKSPSSFRRLRSFMRAISLCLPCFLLTLLTAPAESALVKFEYDAAGNMVSEQGKYYEYNDANQLVRVRKDAPDGEIIAEYVYDYQGQRVKKTENGVTTYYVGKHYEERKGATVEEKIDYFFANNQRIAKSTRKNKAPPEVSYYLNNHLGSADVIIDEQGTQTDRLRYFPYGGYRTFPQEKHTFTGKERDEVTDNYYFEARYYNPNIRRFTQADTIVPDLYDPQSLNRYAYTRNSPVVYTDPSGHLFWDIIDVLSFAQSAYTFANDPTWANAGWLAADTVGLLPGLPGASTVKVGVKGAGALADVAKTVDKASDAVTVAKKVENASDVVELGVKEGKNFSGEAHNAAEYAKYKEHLRWSEKYGSGGVKQLDNNQIRYYGEVKQADKAGEMVGTRKVIERNYSTGKERVWFETLDHNGNVRQVRPELFGKDKTHYMFDEYGNYTGKW